MQHGSPIPRETPRTFATQKEPLGPIASYTMKLTTHQLESLYNHLLGAGPNDALQGELLDHLACQVEEAMQRGLSFEAARTEAFAEADPGRVRMLKNSYRRELAPAGDGSQPASLTEMVFEYRNKSYGAYPIRQAYPGTVLNALFMGTALFIILLLGGLNLLG